MGKRKSGRDRCGGGAGQRLGEVVASSTAGSNRSDERRDMEGRPLKGRGAAGELDAGGRGRRKKELVVKSRG